MSYPGGQSSSPAMNRWPVPSDQHPRSFDRLRADVFAFSLLLLSGACGLAQWFVAGWPVGKSQPVGGSVLTGKQLLNFLEVYTRDATATANITRIAILVSTVGGGALILLAGLTLLPINHRPIGTAAMIVALAATAGAIWVLVQAQKVLGSPASSLLSGDNLGWYLMAATAVIGVFGSMKALSRH